MTKLVVIDSVELEQLVEAAVRRAVSPGSGEWVDARTSELGRRTFLRLAREGAFPVSRSGKKLVARRADIDSYLERQRVEASRNSLAQGHPDSEPDPVARALAAGRLRVLKKPR
jgi:hypothetical protein